MDEISEKAANAAATAKVAADKVKAIAKLKFDIHADKVRLDECYESLGRMCVESWDGACECTEKMSEIVADAKKLIASIEEKEAELRKITPTVTRIS